MRTFRPKVSRRHRMSAEEKSAWRARTIQQLSERGFTVAHLEAKDDRALWQMKNRFINSEGPRALGKLNIRPYFKRWR